MKTKIVTTGNAFTDIDALACTIAYAELLNLEGYTAKAIVPGVLNSSITKSVKAFNFKYDLNSKEKDFEAIIVDISRFDQFADFVKLEQIVEIYDHHFGFQEFWKKRIGENSHIEMIGACATLIWEEFKKRGYKSKISKVSANLLYTAIISNTLNFESSLIDTRDKIAFEELKQYIDLPKDWASIYLKEVEEDILKDVKQAILNDTKVFEIPSINFPLTIGQIEIWNTDKFLLQKQEMEKALKSFSCEDWLLNIACISKKINYIYTKSDKIKKILSEIISINFDGDIGTTNKLWLRKEIVSKLYKYSDK